MPKLTESQKGALKLPPLSKWKKKSYAATEATGAGIANRWYGNVEIDHWEPGVAKCNVSLFKHQPAGAKPPPGWKTQSTPKGKTWQRIEREINPPGGTHWTGWPSAGAARKAAQAHLDVHPEDFEHWPATWPYPSLRKPHETKTKGLGSGYYKPKAKSGTPVGYGKNDTVRLKIVGGTTDSPLYQGTDSKGRSRYELPPPKDQTAREVAREFKKAAKADQKVLGGTIYVIRFHRPGVGEFRYWKAS